MSENIPHSLGGFRGAFESEHGRKPTEREIWNAAIRSWRDLTQQKSDVAKERVVEDLLMYAGDNGYSHIDYADTMRHAAALLQSTALPAPDGEVAKGTWEHLKLMMEVSAWEGKIVLSDALANIDEFAAMPVGELTDADVRAVGGIVHRDGNVFFTNVAQLNRAILAAARSQPTTEESLVVAGAQPVREPLTNCRNCGGEDNVLCAGQCKTSGITKKGAP